MAVTTETKPTLTTETVHWRDKRCVACKGELPLPTWAGKPYICCSGIDCGCGGGRLPIEFCSVDCWENYDPDRAPPRGCKCDPDEWGTIEIPPVCRRYTPLHDVDHADCERCEHPESCHGG